MEKKEESKGAQSDLTTKEVIEEKERIISPFVTTNMSWDDKEFNFSSELKNALKDGMNWERP